MPLPQSESGPAVAYTYDAFDRTETVTDWLGNVTRCVYDDVGNLTDTNYPDGMGLVATRTYDDADRLESLVNDRRGDPISSFEYALDAVGNRTQLTDTTNGLTDVTGYTYDDLYRLRAVLNVDSQYDTYSYDQVGIRLTEWLSPYEYDAADQMSSAYSSLDADGDGCTGTEEAALGSVFDPNAYYDVYDVAVPARADPAPNGLKNGTVDMSDVLAVLLYVFADPSGACGDNPNGSGVDYDCDKGIDTNGDTIADIPPDGVPDGIEYERSPGLGPDSETGIDPAGPPDGVIDVRDILAVLAQAFVVDCNGGP